ncbi:MAG TPA: L-threonylcarbamoyladenylate synthase [Solirubrobacteraceae bacterium]|jgi:L-threonylcarbamoyladenylate synthase|nr:L-threonylcarbamoyladenylate synthase [Solirubrobacteraceae bacterium]
MNVTLDDEAADRLRDCVTAGGVAVFPSDTVYGVCCDPDNQEAARRLYALKGRPSGRACAVMFFALEDALEVLDDLHDSECEALHALLPGPVTVLLANRSQRFAPACRVDPSTLGLRVPDFTGALEPLATVGVPVLQSSANLSGEPDARTLDAVPERLLESVDLVIDGGELPGTPSTVIDLRDLDEEHRWYVLRDGALPRERVERALAALV